MEFYALFYRMKLLGLLYLIFLCAKYDVRVNFVMTYLIHAFVLL